MGQSAPATIHPPYPPSRRIKPSHTDRQTRFSVERNQFGAVLIRVDVAAMQFPSVAAVDAYLEGLAR
jgi:hypothetical protein